jgi:hypothetical protein
MASSVPRFGDHQRGFSRVAHDHDQGRDDLGAFIQQINNLQDIVA